MLAPVPTFLALSWRRLGPAVSAYADSDHSIDWWEMTLLFKLVLFELAVIHFSFTFQAACSPTTVCGERGPAPGASALGASLQAARMALEEAGWVAQALGPRAGTRPGAHPAPPCPPCLCGPVSRGFPTCEAKRL